MYTIYTKVGLALFLAGTMASASGQQKKTLPASPEAASVAKYVNFPVDYSTGLASITIPLYTVQAGDLSLPISLSYHAGGLKANQISTWVGLGWSLSGEPEISRTVNSRTDESVGGFLSATVNQYGSYYDTNNLTTKARGITTGGLDFDPDEFYYKLPNSSGKFYFANNIPTVQYKAMPVPYVPLKIQMFRAGKPQTIIDVDGTYYEFGRNDALESTPNAVTTWKCNRIISASKKDTISFSYSAQQDVMHVGFNERYEVYDAFGVGSFTNAASPIGFGPNIQNGYFTNNPSGPFNQGTPRVLNYSAGSNNGIYLVAPDNTGNPVFYKSYSNTTLPAWLSLYSKVVKVTTVTYRSGKLSYFKNPHANRLDSIQIADREGKLLKSIQFCLHNVDDHPLVESDHADNMTLLDSVIVRDNTGKRVERYAFDYNAAFGMAYGTKQSDPWGYYNGGNPASISSPLSAVPLQTVTGIVSRYSTNQTSYNVPARQMDFKIGGSTPSVSDANQALMLRKIVYPTGGRTEFSYETNQTKDGRAGGLRIRNIKYYADNSGYTTLEKHYRYGQNEDGNGFYMAPDYLENYSYEQTAYYVDPSISGYSDPASDPNHLMKYSFVTERKRTYFAHSMQDMSFSSGAPVVYGTVTEYQIDHGAQTGKTVYEYNYNSGVTNYSRLVGNMTQKFDEWPWGQLTGVMKYAFLNGGYVWVERQNMKYTAHTRPEAIRVLKAFSRREINLEQAATPDMIPDFDTEFYTYPYNLTSGVQLPASTITVTRDLADTTHAISVEKRNYYDNPASIYATRQTTLDSRGNLITTYTSHPADYAATDIAMKRLVDSNVLAVPIEQVTTLKKPGSTPAVVIKGELNSFANDGSGLLVSTSEIEPSAPVATSNFKFSFAPANSAPENAFGSSNLLPDTSYKLKTSLLYDERSNVRQVAQNMSDTTSYIFGYDKLYPIAAVNHAPFDQIAFTSFETNEKGNWEFGGITVSDARTGTRCYVIQPTSAGRITKAGLIASKKYIVSYWSKNATAYVVTGAIGSAKLIDSIQNLNGAGVWYHFEHQVTGTSAVAINGSGYMDELRLYPADSEMTTYTYTAGVGPTTMTDQKGLSVFYIYDAYGRLSLIKDRKGNILKQIKYKLTNE